MSCEAPAKISERHRPTREWVETMRNRRMANVLNTAIRERLSNQRLETRLRKHFPDLVPLYRRLVLLPDDELLAFLRRWGSEPT